MFFLVFLVFLFFPSFFGFILHIPMAKAFWGYLIEKEGSTLEVSYILLHAFYCLVLTLLQNLVYGGTLCDCYFSLFFASFLTFLSCMVLQTLIILHALYMVAVTS